MRAHDCRSILQEDRANAVVPYHTDEGWGEPEGSANEWPSPVRPQQGQDRSLQPSQSRPDAATLLDEAHQTGTKSTSGPASEPKDTAATRQLKTMGARNPNSISCCLVEGFLTSRDDTSSYQTAF